MAMETSPEHPAPVRVVSAKIGAWIDRLGSIWVEGQVTQMNRRAGARVAFLVLRDPSANMSLQVTCPMALVAGTTPPLVEGARVVVHGKPSWYHARGALTLAVDEIRPVGTGALLARIDELRRLLAAEGLFAAEVKRRLPFLPNRVGLIVGRASAAEHDVLENARLRAPGVPFEVVNVPVQGPRAVPEVLASIRRLDADPGIDVIIVARGGGSVEDLLPFSDEALVRAVAGCCTPVVSAIGHETDAPLLDLVADVRASTPTDAARRVVPDVDEERRRVGEARSRTHRRLRASIDTGHAWLDAQRRHPFLARPAQAVVEPRRLDVERARVDARRSALATVQAQHVQVSHTRAAVRALSPAATLQRGYAVVQLDDGTVVRAPSQVNPGDRLRVRLAEGEVAATVAGEPAEQSA